MTLGRTPWVDRTMRSFWDDIAEHVPPEWMPAKEPGKKFVIDEYGCGHYGCVTPTEDPDVVFKLTSDITEARFVAMAMSLPPTEGIVEYHKIFALKNATYRNRPLFVLWRQAAKDIGLLFDAQFYRLSTSLEERGYDEYQIRNLREGTKELNKFLDWAREARRRMANMSKRVDHENRKEMLSRFWEAFETAPAGIVDPRHVRRGLPRIGVELKMCWDIAMTIQNTDVVYPLGAALGYYMDEGILLADVHLNNIGRDKNNELIITDPGHAVEFHPKWTKLPEVEVI